jgi:hypothetical protein
MLTLLRRALPYVAVFLMGSVAAVFATADPPKCDWAFREDYSLDNAGVEGASTPEGALRRLPAFSRSVTVPDEAVRATEGANHYEKIGTDDAGGVGYFVYLDGVSRVEAYVAQGTDGTYYLSGISTCLGV